MFSDLSKEEIMRKIGQPDVGKADVELGVGKKDGELKEVKPDGEPEGDK